MVYYVNHGSKFGKTFTAKCHGDALAFAAGYAYMKGWESDVNVYCRSTEEYIIKDFTGISPILALHYIDFESVWFGLRRGV